MNTDLKERGMAQAFEAAMAMTEMVVDKAYPGTTGRLRDHEMICYAVDRARRFADRDGDASETAQAYLRVATTIAERAVGHTQARLEAVLDNGVMPDDGGNPHEESIDQDKPNPEVKRVYLHVYTNAGRCIRSAPIKANMSEKRGGVPIPLLSTLLSLGMVATHWIEDENLGESSGLAMTKDESFIIRIKTDPMQRDMRSIGALETMNDIRRRGIEISLNDAWML